MQSWPGVSTSEMCAYYYFMPTSVGNGASWKIVVRDVTGVVSVNFARRGSSMHSHFYLQSGNVSCLVYSVLCVVCDAIKLTHVRRVDRSGTASPTFTTVDRIQPGA
jgi:hypothetical protein